MVHSSHPIFKWLFNLRTISICSSLMPVWMTAFNVCHFRRKMNKHFCAIAFIVVKILHLIIYACRKLIQWHQRTSKWRIDTETKCSFKQKWEKLFPSMKDNKPSSALTFSNFSIMITVDHFISVGTVQIFKTQNLITN